ncbi:hypothetical protein CN326_22375 [Bacillus sp. AFS018417]|nr:hypothetical protein CN326_22375 [Bacillus sp. AFS018417]
MSFQEEPPLLKLLPEISWLTKENMPILLAITNKKLLVYKQQLNYPHLKSSRIFEEGDSQKGQLRQNT